MLRTYQFSSESVTDGHPDKLADQISDSVLDAVLGQDPSGRVACETLVSTRMCVLAGEVTTTAEVDYESVARDTIRRVGYVSNRFGYDADDVIIDVRLDPQSPDIAGGVDSAEEVRGGSAIADPLDCQGAGDQGMMFGFACTETNTSMPLGIHLAHRLAERLSEVRRAGDVDYLGPDGKTQVTLDYEGHRPIGVRAIVISAQHSADVERDMIEPDLRKLVVEPVLLTLGLEADGLTLHVNPSGRFVHGGPAADAGLTGRKIIVDTYGGAARHGGGAFSGKDPSKVDRSAAYAARWVAKNVVASGAAERCEVQVAYAIGRANPMSVMVETFGTERVDPMSIDSAIRAVFDLRPAAILRDLDLRRPIFAKTAAFGHFGRDDDDFTWERTSRADDLRRMLDL